MTCPTAAHALPDKSFLQTTTQHICRHAQYLQATKVLLWPACKNRCYAHHMHSASQQLFAALLRRFEPAPAHARLRKSRPAQRTRSGRVTALLQSVRTDHGALAPLITTIFVAWALAADGDAWPQATPEQLQWPTAIQRDQNGHDLPPLPRRRIPNAC